MTDSATEDHLLQNMDADEIELGIPEISFPRLDQAVSTNASSSSFSHSKFLSEMTDYFDGKFMSLKRELTEDVQQVSREKRHRSSEHNFKKKGNKMQHEHNAEIGRHMEDANVQLRREQPNACC